MSEYQPGRILLVEDDEERCAWFRGRFAGHTIDVTCDAAQAVRWLIARDYSIILLDHDLLDEHYFSDAPDDERTGYAVAHYLARHADCQHSLAQRLRRGANARCVARGRPQRRTHTVPVSCFKSEILICPHTLPNRSSQLTKEAGIRYISATQ